RYNTERPETTMYGINVLSGAERECIVRKALSQATRYEHIKSLSFKNPLGDGRAGERIARILKEFADFRIGLKEPDLRKTPFMVYRLLGSAAVSSADVLVCFDEKGMPCLPPRDLKRCWRALLRFPTSAENLLDN
ncbi:MAG: hypothetical protein QXJ64_06840, partial [Thermosphaera sp.]